MIPSGVRALQVAAGQDCECFKKTQLLFLSPLLEPLSSKSLIPWFLEILPGQQLKRQQEVVFRWAALNLRIIWQRYRQLCVVKKTDLYKGREW